MGIMRNLAKEGIGLGGKLLLDAADRKTGGLTSKLVNSLTSSLNNHSGLIGKVANLIGHKIFAEETRNKMGNFVDKALEFVPDGKIKDALNNINNSAQGREVKVESPLNKDTSKNKIAQQDFVSNIERKPIERKQRKSRASSAKQPKQRKPPKTKIKKKHIEKPIKSSKKRIKKEPREKNDNPFLPPTKRKLIIQNWLKGEENEHWEVLPGKQKGKYIVRLRKNTVK